MKHVRKAALVASAFTCAALFSFGWSEQDGISLSIESAQARVGRPLTPVSVAGVARRQTRRAAYGYGVGAGVAGAAAIGTAAAVAATSPTWGWGSPYATTPAYYGGLGGAYAAQTDPDFGKPHYAIRASSGNAPYYGYTGWEDYSGRNFLKCQPGTMTKLDDGRMYRCQ